MKKLFTFFISLLLLLSCGKQQEPQQNGSDSDNSSSQEPIEELSAMYKGSVFVVFNEQEFETQDIEVKFSKDDENNSTLSLYKVKFVPQMPVTIDLDVPGVSYEKREDCYILTGNGIVPTMGGNPFDKYTATDISGVATKDALSFSLNFGIYPTRYEGRRIAE